MPLSPVETFETDITEEIKNTQGRVTDVLAAHSSAPPRTPNQGIIGFIIFLIILLLLSLAGVIWYYFDQKQKTAEQFAKQAEEVQVVGAPLQMSKILPRTASRIDRLVTKTKKAPSGYAFTITDYREVYGSLLADETGFGLELIAIFGLDTKTTPIFKDVTINNQDIRIATLIMRSTTTLDVVPVVATTTSPSKPSMPSIFPEGYNPKEQFSTTTTTIVTSTSTATSTKSASTTKTTSTTKTASTKTTNTTPNPVATSTKIVATSTKQITTASSTKQTSTATSSKATNTSSTSTFAQTASSTATGTVATSTPPQEEVIDPSLLLYVSYGFVGTSTLIISTSPDKFLEVRGGILK